VVPLQSWLPDNLLLQIARENAVAETAFFVYEAEKIHLRWFTPEIEMDLCGHATLATAHCLKEILKHERDEMTFQTLSGDLTVTAHQGLYTMDFPSRMPVMANLPENILNSLSIKPQEVFKSRDYVLVYTKEADVRNIKIDRVQFDQLNLDPGGIIVTAMGDNCDFVSRFFTPQASILEDPVTGSAHCSLIPFWAARLNKNKLNAIQVSERMGTLYCENKGDRVHISGEARTYLMGKIWLP
jgi:PhzF family phenazine biosynthesis protein